VRKVVPTHFLYDYSVGREVFTPTGSVIKYSEFDTLPSKEGNCYLCGQEGPGYPRAKVIKPTFTDHGLAKSPESVVVCVPCTWSLSLRSLRNYSLYVSKTGLKHPSRAEWRKILVSRPDPPYLVCIAVSGQKWLHFKGIVGLSNRVWTVILEETPVNFEPAKLRNLLDTVEQLYNGGFTKAEIQTGDYQAHRIQAFGFERWAELESILEDKRGSRLFELAIFIAQKEGD